MGKFLKKFSTTSEYDTYINGNDKVLPNVSYCEDVGGVYYNPIPETRLIAKYNVTNTTSNTQLLTNMNEVNSIISEMEIDGVMQSNVVKSYKFNTTGEHIIKYTLSNPTTIPSIYYTIQGYPNYIGIFDGCDTLTDIIIPNSVTTLADYAFRGCYGLINVTMGDNITSIGEECFRNCKITNIIIPSSVTNINGNAFSNTLSSITCNAITAPTIKNYTFQFVSTNGTLYVPQGSTGYDVWMGTGNYYLGKHGWTKVEQ